MHISTLHAHAGIKNKRPLNNTNAAFRLIEAHTPNCTQDAASNSTVAQTVADNTCRSYATIKSNGPPGGNLAAQSRVDL